jgi:hypothetical protein
MQILPKRTTALTKQQKLWRSLWAVTLFCLLFPLRYTILKVGLIGGLLGLWLCAWVFFRQRKWVRVVCVIAALFIAGVLLIPGRPANPITLRKAYVVALLPYRGTLYIWSGGNRIGIDCSGLVQRGLIDADFQQGFLTGNPGLIRQGLSLWWHNRSARALGEGYRNETHLLFEAPSLNTMDYSSILPGDIAVLSDGIHTLAYVGNQTWIEADPKPMRVVLEKAPHDQDMYFSSPVRIMRWVQLETEERYVKAQ